MSEGLANVGSIEMAQGTWSQLFIIIKSQILQAEDGMATRKSQEVLSSLLSGWCPASSLTFFLVAFKQNGKEEGVFWTQECRYLHVRTLFLNLGKHH